jgi:ribonuclease P protein component
MNKQHRIKKSEEIKQLVGKRQTVGNSYFVIYYQPRQEDQFRFAVSVNKKWGTAPERNRMKRRMRDIVARHQESFRTIDFLIVAKANCKGIGFEKMKESLAELFHRLVKLQEKA